MLQSLSALHKLGAEVKKCFGQSIQLQQRLQFGMQFASRGGNKSGVSPIDWSTFEMRCKGPGLLGNQHACGDIPQIERRAPVAIEAARGDIAEIQRCRPESPERGVSDHSIKAAEFGRLGCDL